MDRIGRRTYFREYRFSHSPPALPNFHIFFSAVPNVQAIVIGFPGLAICLLAEALLQWRYLGTDDKAGNAACLVVMYVYIIIFQTIDTASFVWAAEVFPTTIRAKGLGLTMMAYFVGAITYTTPAALAFKNM